MWKKGISGKNQKDMNKYAILLISLWVFTSSCENKALNDSEEFRPREIHDEVQFHFDRIEVDGVDYLILEKDNNNPHEGFGFMAFRANVLLEKQDTVLAYLKTITEMQSHLYAQLSRKSIEKSMAFTDSIFNKNLETQLQEIKELEESTLTSKYIDRPKDLEKPN